MAMPGGRPVADHELIVAVFDESVAVGVSAVMAFPLVELCVPGLVTVTVLPELAVTVQVKLADPVKPAESVAVRSTV
jgi:hypothetical protein